MAEAAVANYQRTLAELIRYFPDDAHAGQDNLAALGLKADDRASLRSSRERYTSIWRPTSVQSNTVPWMMIESHLLIPCFTAAMLVTASPIATTASGG
jgi:hypothetical protein